MAINLVRKPSETPNVNNFDDYRAFRYATGGYNGVVSNYKNECDYDVDGLNFTVKSGEIFIDGVQAKIDANGVTLNVDNVLGTEYYNVYCEFNFSLIDNQKVEIKAEKSTIDYPVIDKGDDLTENQTGIARLSLYKFKVVDGVINDVVKNFKILTYGKSKIAEFASVDFSKGTIEERLTNLGFKQGSCVISTGGTSSFNTLTRNGNVVLLNLHINRSEITMLTPLNQTVIATIPDNFKLKSGLGIYIEGEVRYNNTSRLIILSISANGEIKPINIFPEDPNATIFIPSSSVIKINNIGYEANPIT